MPLSQGMPSSLESHPGPERLLAASVRQGLVPRPHRCQPSLPPSPARQERPGPPCAHLGKVVHGAVDSALASILHGIRIQHGTILAWPRCGDLRVGRWPIPGSLLAAGLEGGRHRAGMGQARRMGSPCRP